MTMLIQICHKIILCLLLSILIISYFEGEAVGDFSLNDLQALDSETLCELYTKRGELGLESDFVNLLLSEMYRRNIFCENTTLVDMLPKESNNLFMDE